MRDKRGKGRGRGEEREERGRDRPRPLFPRLAFLTVSPMPFARTFRALAQLTDKISTNGQKYDLIETTRDRLHMVLTP